MLVMGANARTEKRRRPPKRADIAKVWQRHPRRQRPATADMRCTVSRGSHQYSFLHGNQWGKLNRSHIRKGRRADIPGPWATSFRVSKTKDSSGTSRCAPRQNQTLEWSESQPVSSDRAHPTADQSREVETAECASTGKSSHPTGVGERFFVGCYHRPPAYHQLHRSPGC